MCAYKYFYDSCCIRCHEAKEEFLVQVKETVQASLARVSDPPPIGCSILFTEPRPAHDKIRTRIFGTRSVSTDSVTAEDDTGSVPSDTKTHDRASINLEDAYDENSTIVGRISTSEPFFEALLVEAKKPFVYDCSNEVLSYYNNYVIY